MKKLFASLTLALVSSTASANFLTPLERYDHGGPVPHAQGRMYQRVHIQDPEDQRTGASVEAFDKGYSAHNLFLAEEGTRLTRTLLTANLPHQAQRGLPQCVRRILEANAIENPFISIVVQAKHALGPRALGTQALSLFCPSAEADQRVEYLAVQTDRSGQNADYSLMLQQPETQISFVDAGHGSVERFQRRIQNSDTRGAIDTAHLQDTDFFSIVRVNGQTTVTLNWIVENPRNFFSRIAGANNARDIVERLDGSIAVEVLARFKSMFQYLPYGFESHRYVFSHPDLARGLGSLDPESRRIQAEIHYLRDGRFEEGRTLSVLPENFQDHRYVFSHPDLASDLGSLDPESRRIQAEIHYLRHGRFEEGRTLSVLPENFQGHRYVFSHPDLARGLGPLDPESRRIQAEIHYLRYGRFEEGRTISRLPTDFNALTYRSMVNVADLPTEFASWEAEAQRIWLEIHYLRSQFPAEINE